MAELSKLLAFMFKEDKEDILAQYNKMLDEAEDEQALLESFGSPTKLAVTISRTYRRSERKLAVEADSKADRPAAEHLIVTPVKKEKEKPQTVDTGLSYADIIEEIRREKAAEEGVEYKPMFFDEPASPALPETAPEPETAEEEAVTEAAGAAEEPAELEQAEEAPAKEDEESEKPEEAEPAETEGAETETETEEQTEAVEEPSEEAEEETVVEEAPAEEPEAEPEEEEPSEETPADETEAVQAQEEPEAEAEIFFEEPESASLPAEETRYKTNVALLILYLIFAIPVGLVLLALSVVLTLVLLGLGVLVIAAGAKLMAFAFSSLVIFADIMLCAGAVLIAFAAALILLWLGILMLMRGISGMAGGLVSLGRRLCVKEVPVNG